MVVDSSPTVHPGLKPVSPRKPHAESVDLGTQKPPRGKHFVADTRNDEASIGARDHSTFDSEDRDSIVSSSSVQSRRERLRSAFNKAGPMALSVNSELKRNLEAASAVMEVTRSSSGSSSSSSLSKEELSSVARRAIKLSKVAAKIKTTKGSNASTVQKFLENQKRREAESSTAKEEIEDPSPSADEQSKSSSEPKADAEPSESGSKSETDLSATTPTTGHSARSASTYEKNLDGLSRSERFAYMRRQHRLSGGAESPLFKRDHRKWMSNATSPSASIKPTIAEKVKHVQQEEFGEQKRVTEKERVDDEFTSDRQSNPAPSDSYSDTADNDTRNFSELFSNESAEAPFESSANSVENSILLGEDLSSSSQKGSTDFFHNSTVSSKQASMKSERAHLSKDEEQLFSYTESSSKSRDGRHSSGSLSSKQEAKLWWEKNYGKTKFPRVENAIVKESLRKQSKKTAEPASQFDDDVFDGLDDAATNGGGSSGYDGDETNADTNIFAEISRKEYSDRASFEKKQTKLTNPYSKKTSPKDRKDVEAIGDVVPNEDVKDDQSIDDESMSSSLKDIDTVFMNLGCGVVTQLADSCPVPDQEGLQRCVDTSREKCSDFVHVTKERFSGSQTNDKSHPEQGLTVEEKKVWDNWDRVEELGEITHGPRASESVSFSSVSTGRKHKHEVRKQEARMNIDKHTRRAMAAYGPISECEETVGSLTKTSTGSILKVKATSSTRSGSSYSENGKAKSSGSDSISKASTKQVASNFSDDQRSILVNFSYRLKFHGVEVLKLNRKNKLQRRYLTVSKEETFLTPDEVGTIGQCPRALLWLKSFKKENQTYALLRDEGRGGLSFPDLNIIDACSEVPTDVKLPWRLRRKYKNFGGVRLNYSFDGGSRTVLFCFPDKQDAANFCTAVTVIRAVVKREEEIQRKLREKANEAVKNEITNRLN